MLRFYSGQAAGTSAGTWRAPSGHPAGRTCWQCWTPRQPGTRGPLSAGMSKEGDPRLWSITQKNTPVHSTAWFGKMCFRSGGGMSGSVPSFTVKFCIGAFLTEAVKWIAKWSASKRAAGKARLSGWICFLWKLIHWRTMES